MSEQIGPEFKRLREPRLINSYSIDDIDAARLLVERPVVGDAAERMDDRTLGYLRDSLKAQHGATEDPVRFLIIDREFHLAIYRCCGNPALADFVADLYAYMMEHRCKAVSEPGAILRSVGDHKAIVEALERRDRSAVIEAFTFHIERIYRTTLTVLNGSAVESGVLENG